MPNKKTESDHIAEAKAAVLAAALPNVAFDGWCEAVLRDAIREAGVDAGLARQAFPRGAVDLAYAFHLAGDETLAKRLASEDLSALRYRDKVARAVVMRLEIAEPDKEAVRRGATLFALPLYASDGAKAIWNTADTIWTGLGDTSQDVNWYSKRLTLSGVYSASALYWLGDTSFDMAPTKAFVDRRIDNVMQFEKFKSDMRANPLGRAFAAGPGRLLDWVKAPSQTAPNDLPGRWRP